MNSVIRERVAQLEADRAEWHRNQEKKSLDADIMKEVRFLEDRADAVERSGFVETACSLLDQAHSGVRTKSLLAQLLTLREEIEE